MTILVPDAVEGGGLMFVCVLCFCICGLILFTGRTGPSRGSRGKMTGKRAGLWTLTRGSSTKGSLQRSVIENRFIAVESLYMCDRCAIRWLNFRHKT